MLKKLLITLALGLSLVFASTVMAYPYLVSNPHDSATYYIIRLLNDPADETDDQLFNVNAQEDGSLRADLINFPAGDNQVKVLAGNVFYESVEVPFEFSKTLPGVPSNIALVNIDGLAYLFSAPQETISHYRVIIDGEEYVVDAQADGREAVEPEDGLGRLLIASLDIGHVPEVNEAV